MARRYTPEDIADIITNSDEEYIRIDYRIILGNYRQGRS